MRRTVLLYGLALAAAALLLQWLEYRLFVRAHSVALYVVVVAMVFAALGAWMMSRVTGVTSAPGFVLNDRALASLDISRRELAVLQLLADGQSNKEIARTLSVSPNTVKTHVASLFEKLDVERRTQVVQRARELGLLP